MTTGSTYHATSYGLAPASRPGPGSTPQSATPGRFLESLRHLRERGWFRSLQELPDSFSDDAAPDPHRAARELRSELYLLDARLHTRLY